MFVVEFLPSNRSGRVAVIDICDRAVDSFGDSSLLL